MSIVIVSALLFPYCFKAIITKQKSIGSELYLDFCSLFKKRTISAGIYDKSIDWLYPVSVPKSSWDINKRCHSVFEYVSILNVLHAYWLSLISIIGIEKVIRFKYLIRSYTSFDFFLTYLFFENISDGVTLYFANQIDRWAVLFDRTKQKEKVLLQHGIEMPEADWPIKMERTNTAYVLSKDESNNLFHAVFKKLPQNVYVMSPTISLVDTQETGFKVLVVCFPGYSKLEIETMIVKELDLDGVFVFLKPHPSQKDLSLYKKLADESSNCKLITSQTFPNVDLVVSYRSTLAVEYQAHKKRVLLYDDYIGDNLIEKIKTIIKHT